MALYPHYPDALSGGEFAVVRFDLELLDDGTLGLDRRLGLRRPLRRAARAALGERAGPLLDPPLSADPVARRRYQKPAPGFVVLPPAGAAGELLAGDRLQLEVLFLGTTTQSIGDFFSILEQLGAAGLTGDALRFRLAAAAVLGPDGSWSPLWRAGRRRDALAPTLLRLDQWLERCWPERLTVALAFDTPVRLVAGGRVLRRPRFDQLFPFILRRVTAMLHDCCALEPVAEPAPLLAAARGVEAVWSEVRWCDWMETEGEERLGGLTGRLCLAGPALDGLLWILLLGALLGTGRGAAYGAGRYRLLPA